MPSARCTSSPNPASPGSLAKASPASGAICSPKRSNMRNLALVGALLLAGCAASGGTQSGGIVMEEAMVPSDSGMSVYVRNKRPASMTRFSADKTVLFVHGATYPSETAFDLQLDGTSWMDYIARAGYDVYLVDVRGYGRSTRPAAMDQP